MRLVRLACAVGIAAIAQPDSLLETHYNLLAQPAIDTLASVRWKLLSVRFARQALIPVMTGSDLARRDSTLRVLSEANQLSGEMGPIVSVAMFLAADSTMANSEHASMRAAISAAAADVIMHFHSELASAVRLELDRDLGGERKQPANGARAESGERIGHAMAERAIQFASRTMSKRPWSGTIPKAAGIWWSAPGRAPDLVDRLQQTPWMLRSIDQFRPAPPPAFGSREFDGALDEVRRVSRTRSAEQTAIAQRWGLEFAVDVWERLISAELVRERATDLKSAAVLAMVATVANDAGLACTDAKYHYLLIRPSQADSTISLADRIALPNFPSYPSGHACISGAIAEVVGHYLPDYRAEATRLANEAATSRLFAGLHYRFDNDTGLALGRRVAHYAVARADSGFFTRDQVAPWPRRPKR